jgi:multidrug efflux pump subunit AcrB
MSSFNLSDWALSHKSFVIYLMLISAIAGLMAYNSLGREEDPPFTIKVMVIKTLWPGATTTETINQITDRIEKKLEEVPHLDFVRSYTKPGESIVFVNLKDSVRASEVPDLWYQVRKKVGDIRQNLPSGIYGPYFNDEFGDTYSIIYALTTDGFSRREVRDYAERIRTELLRVPDVAKVDLIGVQDEKIYLEFSTQQIAALGLDINALAQALQAQNAVAPSGVVEAGPERIAIRISGGFTSEESLKSINFTSNGRFFRLSDIVKIRRGYIDPPQPLFRYKGEPAIGLAIAMAAGGDALTLGKNVEARAERIGTSDYQAIAGKARVRMSLN